MEWVSKAQNLNSVNVSVSSITKNVFGRLFRYLVDMCNATLVDPSMKKVNFIGVLDIAGMLKCYIVRTKGVKKVLTFSFRTKRIRDFRV